MRLHEGRTALVLLLAALLLVSAVASLSLRAQGYRDLSFTWLREVLTCLLLLPHVSLDRHRLRLNTALFLTSSVHLALFLADTLKASSLLSSDRAAELSARPFLLSEEGYLCILGIGIATFMLRVRRQELSKLKASAQQGRIVQVKFTLPT